MDEDIILNRGGSEALQKYHNLMNKTLSTTRFLQEVMKKDSKYSHHRLQYQYKKSPKMRYSLLSEEENSTKFDFEIPSDNLSSHSVSDLESELTFEKLDSRKHRKKLKMGALNTFKVKVKKYEESLYNDFD